MGGGQTGRVPLLMLHIAATEAGPPKQTPQRASGFDCPLTLQRSLVAMLDRLARRLIDPWLEAPARRIAGFGVSANAVTFAGFVVGIAGCVAIGVGQYLVGLACILANRVADGLDGSVARQSRSTDVGGFLDFVLDVIFYGGVPLAFAIAQPAAVLPASFLIYSFMGTTGSFLAYAVISAKRGMTSDHGGRKSFFYSAGLMEGTETVIFFSLFCLFPRWFAVLAWTFGGLCWVTVAMRIAVGVVAFRDRDRQLTPGSVGSAARSPAPEETR
jgi:phosphatidylglycerophosphate synthase